MANELTHDKLRQEDPIQGHDVWAAAYAYDKEDEKPAEAFQNAFSDIMFKIVNQTETYLPLFSRVPRFLDGEIIIVWSCSAGVISMNFINETFGERFANAIENGRTLRVPRSRRFSLHFMVQTDESTSSESGMVNSNLADKSKGIGAQMVLKYCRCDTLSFGIQAGKGYAVNSWQGTAEGIEEKAVSTRLATDVAATL